MGPSSCGASLSVPYIAVGPSAPPIKPMEDASLTPKLNALGNKAVRPMAPMKAMNMPNWAAAPMNRVLGLAIRGPKSVPAPTPMNIRQG